MENPFKFGTIVEAEYFTDRQDEVRYICQFIQSTNHLILISPRRFGKGKADVFANAIKHDFKSKNPTTRWSDIIKLK